MPGAADPANRRRRPVLRVLSQADGRRLSKVICFVLLEWVPDLWGVSVQPEVAAGAPGGLPGVPAEVCRPPGAVPQR